MYGSRRVGACLSAPREVAATDDCRGRLVIQD